MSRLALIATLALVGCFDQPDFGPHDAAVEVDVGGAGGQGGVEPEPDFGGGGSVEPDAAELDGGADDVDAGAGGQAGQGGQGGEAGQGGAAGEGGQGGEPPPMGPALVGRWVSQDDDVAPLLRGNPSFVVRLDATFGADGRYAVEVTNRDQQRFTLSGRYEVDIATTPHAIELVQTQPDPVVSQGIWQVDGDVLRYEVAFVDPPIDGVSPPTPAGGFGSTSGGRFGEDNVQIYRRAE